MGDITTNAADPRVATVPIRPTASAALRASDPAKERLEVGEKRIANGNATSTDERVSQFTLDGDESSVFSVDQANERSARGGRGLLGALTNFLAKMFTQADQGGESAASSRLNGLGAYAQANGQQAANMTSGSNAEIQSPGFPRLASGRLLDLSV